MAVVKKNQKYTARYTFEAGDWIVEIEQIPQVHSFARTLARARENIRDALALWVQATDPTSLRIDEEFVGLPKGLIEAVAAANEVRARATQLAEAAQGLTAEAAKQLVDEHGMSVRDAAELLHVSHQRVHQLVG
jgi:predicted RNase H-like HicB family nuclease